MTDRNLRAWPGMAPRRPSSRVATLTATVAMSLATAALPLAAAASPAYTTYYVSGSGSDAADGRSPATAVRTIQRGLDIAAGGDIVTVMDGTYTPTNGFTIADITKSGSGRSYTTLKAGPNAHPKLSVPRGAAWSAVTVDGASYVRVKGLTLVGGNAHITTAQAIAGRNPGSPEFNTSGINVQPDGAGRHPSHVDIAGNTVSDFPGGGIGTAKSDWVTIEDNVVHGNARYSAYANSGISLWESYDTDASTGVKMVVKNNVSYDNANTVPYYQGKVSDSNGIIVDTTEGRNGDGTSYGAAYHGRTLIANNLVHDNGGSGLHTYLAAHVDFVNNTAYHDVRSADLSDWSSLFANQSDDVHFTNNIVVPLTGGHANSGYLNTNVSFTYNLYGGGAVPDVSGQHDLRGDPKFANVAGRDFHLKAGSPGVDSGTSQVPIVEDLDHRPRPTGPGYDRGAYEYQPPTVT